MPLGRRTVSSSTNAAGLKVRYCRRIAKLSAERRVLRISSFVAGPVMRRYGFMSASWARSASSSARSAPGGRDRFPHVARASCSRLAAFSARITSLASSMPSKYA
jgi:hypothetical protein